jgi:hypothetical protein
MTNPSFNMRPKQSISLTPETSSPPPISPAASTTPIPVSVTVAAASAAKVPEDAAALPESVEVRAVPTPLLSAAEAVALSLSPAQLLAMGRMLSGHTLGDAAGAAGVTRMTLYRWLHYDAKFQAAYNAWQLDALTSIRTKLMSIGDAAVNTIGRAVKTDPKVALAVLKALGTLEPPKPGSTDPEEVLQRMEVERRDKEEKMAEERYFSSLGGLNGFRPRDVGKPVEQPPTTPTAEAQSRAAAAIAQGRNPKG